MKANHKNILLRYGVATIGVCLVSLGTAFSIISNLGTAPLSCAAYVLNLRFTSISVGTFIFLVNVACILIQLAVLGRRFKPEYLLQVIASAIFGYFADAWLWAFSWMVPSSFLARLAVTLLAGVVTAIGVSIEAASHGWMLSAEMTVSAFSTVYGKDFGKVKIVMDSLMVVLAAVLALIFFANPFGGGEFTNIVDILLAKAPGVVIGIGTLILAVLPGWLMRFTDPIVRKFFAKFLPSLVK